MAWFHGVFDAGWIDVIESDCATRPLYTWWQRPDLFERGRGTRVDYILATTSAHDRIGTGSAQVMTDQRRGGHAQIAIAIDPV
jgi:exonuclease III